MARTRQAQLPWGKPGRVLQQAGDVLLIEELIQGQHIFTVCEYSVTIPHRQQATTHLDDALKIYNERSYELRS